MPEIKLKPCPFCGQPINLIEGNALFGWHKPSCFWHYLDDGKISAMSQEELTSEAIKAWNHRANEENEPLTLEDLRKMDGEPSPGEYVVCWAKRNPFSGYMPMVAKVAANGFINPVTGLYITEIKNWAKINMPDPPKEE